MNVFRGCRWVLSVGALALVGCVPGYNSMIFATKTNAGLVVDTKPPEVNVDIGRFEGLFAPTYEAGKTPPVMASFRFDSNKGFLSNYIGSAFTTGDAAVAMARLYDTPDNKPALDTANGMNSSDPEKWNSGAAWKNIEKNYDSAVDLAMVPKQPWFVPKEEPGAVRPVLFATDTSFGFKVSWQTAESPLPDYLRLAYQRREIAFAAVTVGPKLKVDPTGETAPQALNGLEARVPSLLATVDAQVRANEFINSDFNYLQYFASGSAATALAMRRGVRDAMLHRLDPKQEQQPNKGSSAFSGATEKNAIETLAVMHKFYETRAGDESAAPDERALAAKHLKNLDQLFRLVPESFPFDDYREKTRPEYEINPLVNKGTKPARVGFRSVTTYWDQVKATQKHVSDMIGVSGLKISGPGTGDPRLADPNSALVQELAKLKTEGESFSKLVTTNADVIEAQKDFSKRFSGGC